MKKHLLFLAAMLPALAQAQVSTYTFTNAAGVYEPLTGGTVLQDPGHTLNDDAAFNRLPIGFTFVFNGIASDTFAVNTNGYMAIGPRVTNLGADYSFVSNHDGLALASTQAGASNNIVAGMNLDLVAVDSSLLSYQTLGTAPNRRLVIQWRAYKVYSGSDRLNFQIQLLEGTNQVVTSYGINRGGSSSGYDALVGLRGNNKDDFNRRITTTDWAASTAARSNVPFGSGMRLSSTVVPANGLRFTWTPTVTATRSHVGAAAVTAYPTPTTGRVCLRGLPAARVGTEAILSDLSGRVLGRRILAAEMDLTDLPAGLYRLTADGLRVQVAVVR